MYIKKKFKSFQCTILKNALRRTKCIVYAVHYIIMSYLDNLSSDRFPRLLLPKGENRFLLSSVYQ